MAKKKKWKPKKPIKPPKPPKVVKVARPRVSELRKVYKSLITEDASQRVAALFTAIHWFDAVAGDEEQTSYLRFKTKNTFTPVQLALKEKFLSHWESARDAEKNEQKIQWLVMAIGSVEKLLLSVKVKCPPIGKFIEIAELRQERLDEEAKRLMEKYTKVLTILEFIQPRMPNGRLVKMKVGAIKEPMIVDVEAETIVFSSATAREMYRLLRRKGLLPLFKEVSEPLSRIASYEIERNLNGTPTGRKVVNKDLQFRTLYQLWDNFEKFAMTEDAPKRLVKKPRDYAPTRAHAPVGGFGKREVVAGHYAVGSTGANIVTLMLDYAWHEKEEIEKLIPAGDGKGFEGRIKSMKRRGEKWQVFKVENKGTKFRLIKLEEGNEGD